MRPRYCNIHLWEELNESHPADLENGPSPDDVFNELFCMTCCCELEEAYLNSWCLLHCLPLRECHECLLLDELEKEMTSHG